VIWLQPAAALGILAVIAPLVLHLLARRRAARLPFPTLRFVQPTRLASLRTRALEDPLLLAVRVAVLVLAAAAAAGPLLRTAQRRRASDARTIQTVVDERRQLPGAVAWLQRQPPARREIVVRSAFPIGSFAPADFAQVPAEIGLRFERTSALPSTRTIPAAGALAAGSDDTTRIESIVREMELVGDRTTVRDTGRSGPAVLPLDVEAPDDERAAAEAIVKSLVADRVPAAAPNRRARVIFAASSGLAVAPIRDAWMGDAADRIIRTAATDGDERRRALRFGSLENRLIVATTAHATDLVAAALVRAVFDALAPLPPSNVETIAIPDRELQAWTRAAGPAPPPTRETVRDDDRRWVWAAVLLLLGVEWWLRRSKVRLKADATTAEAARVA
jgi:hypothetical protein